MTALNKQARQVQRYTNYGVDMMEWDDGTYVKYSDYLARLDELEAAEHTAAVDHEAACSLVEENEEVKRKLAAAEKHITELLSENAGLKNSVENAAGCINAAYAEGLIDVLSESNDERLVDLVKRRMLFSYLPVETPATNEELIAMGDWVLREQLEDGTRAIKTLNRRIAELEASHSKLRDTMATIHNTIRMDGGYTPLAAILNAAKRAHEESAIAAVIGVKGE